MKTVFIVVALAALTSIVLSEESVLPKVLKEVPSEVDEQLVKGIPVEVSGSSGLSLPAGRCIYVGQFLPDRIRCDVFYHCDAALIPRQFQCAPGGLCWNQRQLTCQWRNQPGCSCRFGAD